MSHHALADDASARSETPDEPATPPAESPAELLAESPATSPATDEGPVPELPLPRWWRPLDRRPTAGIRLKVYAVRVVRTAASVHIVCGQFRRDPDAVPCDCRTCLGQDLDIARQGRLW